MSAGAIGCFKLGFGLSFGEDADRSAAAERRQCSERCLGATKLIDQRAEGRGPEILAADQPEPAQALTIVQLNSRTG
jgi:hypothetical protein